MTEEEQGRNLEFGYFKQRRQLIERMHCSINAPSCVFPVKVLIGGSHKDPKTFITRKRVSLFSGVQNTWTRRIVILGSGRQRMT